MSRGVACSHHCEEELVSEVECAAAGYIEAAKKGGNG